ncbi:hypothetical protein [Arenimonas fontis]|uniref:TonB C-terminal domain-containing protein n=1 Tax=Arenimonas fontis TaxID=2608255 RepID=A0A5B2Z6S1_9GAMM|nr:hypothetical protein [Arenimonas fontis]KAA2283896.1 hypothetical protein F0415_11780 [Arenimonas fontis]
MRGHLLVLAGLLATLAVSSADARPVTQRFEAQAYGIFTVEPDGRVSEVSLPEALKPPLRGLYENAIRGWTFQPIEIDGQRVRALGHMQLDLYMDVSGTSLVSAGITKVQFIDPPSPSASVPEEGGQSWGMYPPPYPESLLRRGLGGRVEVLVETDESGRVNRAATRGGVLYARAKGIKPGTVRSAFSEFAQASERAAKHWTVSGCQGRCIVPVTFQVQDRSGGMSFWKPVIDVPFVPQPWVLEGESPTMLSSSGVSYSTRFRLDGPTEAVELFREEG